MERISRAQWAMAAGVCLVVFLLLYVLLGSGPDDADPMTIGDAVHPRPDRARRADGVSDAPPEDPVDEPAAAPADPDTKPRDPLTGPADAPDVVRPAESADTPKKGEEPGGSQLVRPGDQDGTGIRYVPFHDEWGLTWIEEDDSAVIGYVRDKILTEAHERGKDGPVNLISEWPENKHRIGAYGIDRFEVTNAQYKRFLDRYALVEYTTRITDYWHSGAEGDPLVALAAYFVRRHIPEGPMWASREAPGWLGLARQLYEANRLVLWEAYPSLVILDPETERPDIQKTYEAFLKKPIRSGIELIFYDMPPPPNWPAMTPPKGRGVNPVRYITHEQARVFAFWAGKHLPTEREWEYAARGPDARLWPWGEDPGGFAARVNGGRVLEDDAKPRTLRVNSMPEGASWCGCHHMLGNVSEWTSTMFHTYENWEQIPDPRKFPWATLQGLREHFILRGGSCADTDPIFTRTTFRGWHRPPEEPPEREEDDKTYYPELEPDPRHTLRWTGMRCARYAEPGRSRLRGMAVAAAVAPATQGARGEGEDPTGAVFDGGAYAAAEALRWVDRDERPADGVYVLNSAVSYVFKPLTPFQRGAVNTAIPGTTTDELVAASTKERVILGLFQQDAEAENTEPMAGYEGYCPPGVYALTLEAGALYLYDLVQNEAKDRRGRPLPVRYWRISKDAVRHQHVRVLEWRKSSRSAPTRSIARLRIDKQSNVVQLESFIPWGSDDENIRALRVRFAVVPPRGFLREALDWQEHQTE